MAASWLRLILSLLYSLFVCIVNQYVFQNVFPREPFGSGAPHSPLSEGGTPNALKVRPACCFVTQGANRF
jgi:hypothetical protein